MIEYSTYRKSSNEEFAGKGTGFFGQAVIAFEPMKDYEVVTLGYLKRWSGEQEGIPVGVGTPFPKVDPSSNNKCVYVNENGVLTHPTSIGEDGSAQKVLGYLRDNRLYMNGHFIKAAGVGSPGLDLWIQPNGDMDVAQTATENTWSVRMGHCIANGVVYVSIYNAGLV